MPSQARIFPLYPIIDLAVLQRPLEPVLAGLAGAGVQWVQLRGKDLSSRDLFQECRRLVALARPLGLKVIVNDRADLALVSGADGVHLGQEDLPAAEARRILGEKAIIGFSTHGLQQALQARDMPVDYVAIGPVFPTRTKENPDPVVERQELQAIQERVAKPLVAIGGITLENAPALFRSGVDSVAVIRDLLPAADIRQRATGYRDLARQVQGRGK